MTAQDGAGGEVAVTDSSALSADPVTVARNLTAALERMSAGLSGVMARLESDDDRFISDLTIALFHLAPDAIIVTGSDGLICLVNKQAEWLTGYHSAAMRGEPVEMLLPVSRRNRHQDAHRPGYMADLRVRPMEASPRLDIRLLHRDGEEIPVDINLSPLVTPRGTFIIATIRRRRGRGA